MEWLFSGLGAGIIIFVLKYFFDKQRKSENKGASSTIGVNMGTAQNQNSGVQIANLSIIQSKTEVSPEFSSTSTSNLQRISICEMYRRIDSTPLLLQSQARENFVGTQVRFRGKVHSLEMKSKEMLSIGMHDLDDYSGEKTTKFARLEVDSSRGAKLMSLNNGDVIEVAGSIIELGVLWIRIGNVVIY